ncbi:DUF4430 domain-containing protein [Desulfosporosinus youngiae]|uniref:Transcobalamin-like C-terminal domain-containing protein n=1 Tax=Desulfosporosinus youngiae DSM 17734 TaxID=768710 RepID=H5Y5R9_9FIRM|nr:DUF4430 domain-containing protein [Desulfosporosinus youngiae]EHQ90795.1 hypothetical protein DesyoDRAFT_3810 [Desulfosporosinus youngiae DSM 17734]
MKKVSVLLILIMLLSLVLTGCGGTKIANGDLPAGITKSVDDSAWKAEESSALETDGKRIEQQPDNTQAVHAALEPSTQESQSDQPSSENQESKSASAVSPPSSGSSGSSEGAVPALTAPPVPQPNTTAENTVTFSISCQTFVAKGFHLKEQFQEAVPADGIILPPTVVEFKEGEKVFDALKQVVRQHKIHMEYEGSKGTPYIQGISNLYEFDGGPLSGWMYCVNKVYPNYGCGEYKLKPGDLIEWNYTCDLGKDLGQTWLSE